MQQWGTVLFDKPRASGRPQPVHCNAPGPDTGSPSMQTPQSKWMRRVIAIVHFGGNVYVTQNDFRTISVGVNPYVTWACLAAAELTYCIVDCIAQDG